MEVAANNKLITHYHKKQTKVPLLSTTKMQNLDQHEQKTFFFDSSDKYMKKILLNHGWKASNTQSADSLRWIYQTRNNTFSQLSPNTLINHFPHSHLLTTKLGLCKTLKGERTSFVNQFGKTYLRFYPRSYDLSEENQIFIKDFRQTAIINLLKKMMIGIELSNDLLFKKLKQETTLKKVKKEVNWLKNLRELYQNNQFYMNGGVTSKQFLVNAKIFQSLLYYLCLMYTLDFQVGEEIVSQVQMNSLVAYSQLNPPYQSLEDHYSGDKNLAKNPTKKALQLFFGLYNQTRKRFPWFRADGLRNIWIVKGSDSSRGRSIVLVSSLSELKVLNSGTKLVQKYIEDTWIINHIEASRLQRYTFLNKIMGKKFDIRIWVLVKSFSPLQVYVYREGYLRISQEQYQLLNISRDKTHLTNFSINWKNSQADSENSYVLLTQFMDFLQLEGYRNKKELMREIRSVIRNTLESADMAVTSKDKRCFQLFGFDILLDFQLRPWLLQVNMSPACKQRGRLAIELQMMGKGILSLIGLVEDKANEQRWTKLELSRMQKKSMKMKKLNKYPTARSEYAIRSVLYKLRSNKTSEDEAIKLSRVTSLLPSITNTHSLHFKTDNISPFNQGMIIVGSSLIGKKLRRLDAYLTTKNAVCILQKHFKRYILVKRQIQKKHRIATKANKVYALTWLQMVQTLNKIVKRSIYRYLKKITKNAVSSKKSFNIRKSVIKHDLNI